MKAAIASLPLPFLKTLINALIFQLGWFVCILFGDYYALAYVVVAMCLHAKFYIKNMRERGLIFVFVLCGWSLDAGFIMVGLLLPGVVLSAALLPLWLMCLWVLVALTLCHSLRFLHARPTLAALTGVVAAPWSYWAGSKLSHNEFEHLSNSLLGIGLAWGLLLPASLYLAAYWVLKNDKAGVQQVKHS